VYFPHNDQLGRTDFPHNALSPQCIVCTYVCVCPHDNLKTIAVNYVDWIEISEELAREAQGSRSRSYFTLFKKYTTSY